MADIYMRILISAQNSASSVIRGVAGDLGKFAPAAIGAGVAILAIGAGLAYSVIQAANFQQGLNRLVTGAGDVTDNMAKMGQAILGISVDTGVMTGPLLQAMYLILSSGQRGARALDTLGVAARGAQIEQANVVDVANVLSGVMTNYGTKVYGATQYMNGLIKAVSSGKITLQDLSVAMGPIDPIAKHLGVSFSDLAAAMTTQTNAMIPAHIAATGLRFLMQGLENPTKKAKDAMSAMGLNSIAVAEEMKKSLPNALEMIYNAALKAGPAGSVPFNRALADMVGGIRGTTAFMGLTGPHFADFARNAAAIAAAMKDGSKGVTGWQLAQSGFNIQMDRAKAAVQAAAITIGTVLLPILTQILRVVTPLITAFAQWIVSMMHNQTALAIFGGVLAGLATIILGVVVPAVVTMLIAIWPILAIGAAVALAVIGIILVMQHWGQIMDWIGNKSEQMRIRVAENHAHMAIDADNKTLEMAHKVIANLETERTGVLQKLKETHDPALKMRLEYELKSIDAQIKGQDARRNAAEKDKQLQLARLKDLHAQMLEAQKFFFVRWIDQLLGWIGNQMGKLGGMVGGWLGWTGRLVGGVMSAIGTFFHNFLGAMGAWIGGVMSNVGSLVHGVINWFLQLPGALLQIGRNMIQGLINGIFSMAGALASAIGTTVHNAVGNIPGLGGILTQFHILGFQHGGIMPYTGLAYLHAGERVIPANRVGSPGGMGGGHVFYNTFAIYVQQLDPREADRVAVLMADKLRAQMGNV